MKLYHGSNLAIQNPEIITSSRTLDFGAGFYVTSSFSQAKRWSEIVVKRRREGIATVSIYEFDEKAFAELAVLKFEQADEYWLDFVVANRKQQPIAEKYDLVIGAVANDATLPVIDDYMDGRYTKAEAVARLLPQNLTDQYAFLTAKALSYLQFERSE
ncbi:DUF3990 domain-containing protein [Lonepinella sp. BR2271]|uniref:DUF3990 domain-containing protein n=1 Tax=Lonepinella sp. BR2271 TaxID=3434550 RepID=UPI003F6E3076